MNSLNDGHRKPWLGRSIYLAGAVATCGALALAMLTFDQQANAADSASTAVGSTLKTASLAKAAPKSSDAQHESVLRKQAYTVDGFRNAHFGMDEKEVRRAIVKDLGVSDKDIKIQRNAQQRTRALVVHVASLAPGPGNAVVSYILGYRSHKLIQVNVIWGLDNNAKKDRADLKDIYSAANTLTYYFGNYSWRDGGVVRNALIDPTTLMLFRGEDLHKGAAEIILGNVPIRVERNAKDAKSASNVKPSKPAGPAYLRVSYVANRVKPDIYSLPKGTF